MSYCNATLHKLIFVLILAYGAVNFSKAGVLGERNIDDQLIKFDVFLKIAMELGAEGATTTI